MKVCNFILFERYNLFIIPFINITDDQPNVIDVEEARRFMIDCFINAKVPEKHARGMKLFK